MPVNIPRPTTIGGALYGISIAAVVLSSLLSYLYQKQSSKSSRRLTNDAAEATFLGFPVVYHTAPTVFESTIHCTGDDLRKSDAWMHRSCQFWNVCWDTSTQDFFYFVSPEEAELQALLSTLQPSNLIAVSSMAWSNQLSQDHKPVKSISLGTIRSSESTSRSWFPKVIADSTQQQAILARGFYQLPDDVTLVPFQLTSRRRMDVWSDCFVLHTVLAMFGLEEQRPALLQYTTGQNHDLLPLDWLSVFGSSSTQLGLFDTAVQTRDDAPQSNLLCARTTVAGLGMIGATHHIMDPATKSGEPPMFTHTIGRGVALYAFRQYALHNLGVTDRDETTPPLLEWSITIAYEAPVERTGWPGRLHRYVSDALSSHDKYAALPIELLDAEQVNIRALAQQASRSKVYLCQSGLAHTLVAATFLSRGSTLIVLDDSSDATHDPLFRASQRSEQHVLEYAGYFRVHWVRINQEKELDQAILAKIVEWVQKDIEEPFP